MTRADLLLIVLAAALVGASAAAFWQPPVAAQRVEVRVGDAEPASYALSGARRIEIEGRLGTSVLAIEDRRVRFISSPCRNKVCIHSGWLSASGDATACLPNRVSITLLGRGAAQIDAVSQ